MPSSISLKRIAFVGRRARMRNAITDLDFPPPSLQRKIIIVVEDHDVHALYGYRAEELRFVAVAPTTRQLNFLAQRGHTEISIEDAAAWLKQL